MGYNGDTVIHCQWEYNRDNVVQPEMSSAGGSPYFDAEFPIVSHVQWAKSLSFLGLSFHCAGWLIAIPTSCVLILHDNPQLI